MPKLSQHLRFITTGGIIALALLSIGIAVAATHQSRTTPARHSNDSLAKAAQKSSTPKTTVTGPTMPTPSTTSTTSPSDADKQTAATGTAAPVTVACKLLTPGIAQQILGNDAQPGSAGDSSSLQATDTSVTGCAYVSSKGSVQLTIRTPTGRLGVSEDDTVFGSGKPSDAVSVSGYGQAAYWDPDRDTLNVLGNNNWYIITREPDTQADAEAIAELLASGF